MLSRHLTVTRPGLQPDGVQEILGSNHEVYRYPRGGRHSSGVAVVHLVEVFHAGVIEPAMPEEPWV